jgi:hypothetical protein
MQSPSFHPDPRVIDVQLGGESNVTLGIVPEPSSAVLTALGSVLAVRRQWASRSIRELLRVEREEEERDSGPT